jgi:hypothetical protein
MERPKYTPKCCGQDAKWVEQTVNLAYFFCTKCKKEVASNDSDYGGYWGVDGADAALRFQGVAPSPTKFQIGDRIQVVNGKNSLWQFGTVEKVPGSAHGYYVVKMDAQNLRELFLEHEIAIASPSSVGLLGKPLQQGATPHSAFRIGDRVKTKDLYNGNTLYGYVDRIIPGPTPDRDEYRIKLHTPTATGVMDVVRYERELTLEP